RASGRTPRGRGCSSVGPRRRPAPPSCSFSSRLRPPPRRSLFPYTTLFRSLRTPVGKHGGALAQVRADDLAAIPITAVVERSGIRSEEHTSELQSLRHLVCRLLLEKKNRTLARPSRLRTCHGGCGAARATAG